MAKYRELKLINGKDNVWKLTDKSFKVFASDLSGFGASKTVNVLRLGLEQIVTSSQFNLDTFGYTIYFYDDSIVDQYQKYNDFIRFLSYKPLYQEYIVPSDKKAYRREIEVISIEKSEVNPETKCLECPVVFQPLTFWMDAESSVIDKDNQIGEGKQYPLARPYAYGNVSLANIPINFEGLIDAPLEISINGTCTDPIYNLSDEDGNMYGVGRFIGTFDKIYVNSDELNQEIILFRNGVKLDNPWSYRDLTVGKPNETFVTFLKLKAGNSRMSFRLGDFFEGSVRLKWRNRYVSI